MKNEILEAEKQRQEIIKRIQEKERLISLLKSRHVKGDLNEIKDFQKKFNEQNKNNLFETLNEEQKIEKENEIKNEEENNIDKKTIAALKFN